MAALFPACIYAQLRTRRNTDVKIRGVCLMRWREYGRRIKIVRVKKMDIMVNVHYLTA